MKFLNNLTIKTIDYDKGADISARENKIVDIYPELSNNIKKVIKSLDSEKNEDEIHLIYRGFNISTQELGRELANYLWHFLMWETKVNFIKWKVFILIIFILRIMGL